MYYFTYFIPSNETDYQFYSEDMIDSTPFKKGDFDKCMETIADIIWQHGVITGMFTMG